MCDDAARVADAADAAALDAFNRRASLAAPRPVAYDCVRGGRADAELGLVLMTYFTASHPALPSSALRRSSRA